MAIETYRAYKAQFAVPETAVLAELESLFAHSHRNLEYSVKIDGDDASYSRFAVIFDHQVDERLAAIDETLSRIATLPGVTLERGLYRRLLEGISSKNVSLCALGIDARPTAAASRLKVWVSVVDDVEKVNDLLEAHGYDDDFLEIVPGNVLLAGVDLSLTGKSRLKLYPKYTAPELANRAIRHRLGRVLGPEVMAWLGHVRRANITLDEDGARTIHLQPRDPDALLSALKNPRVAEVHARYRALGLGLNVVSVAEADLKIGRHEHLNLYYVE